MKYYWIVWYLLDAINQYFEDGKTIEDLANVVNEVERIIPIEYSEGEGTVYDVLSDSKVPLKEILEVMESRQKHLDSMAEDLKGVLEKYEVPDSYLKLIDSYKLLG